MNAPDRVRQVSLDDKYALQSGRVFMTGTQALVRLPMLQRARDLAAGLNTAGFIPAIVALPLVASTTRCGARKHISRKTMSASSPESTRISPPPPSGARSRSTCIPTRNTTASSPCGMAKGGVDRCGDVFKHATRRHSKHGGVLVLAGDDHAAKSSTLAHQSEHIFKACCIPVLNAASVQEYSRPRPARHPMSRFSGCWIAFNASPT